MVGDGGVQGQMTDSQSHTENSDGHLCLLSSVQSISRIFWVSLPQPGRQESEKLVQGPAWSGARALFIFKHSTTHFPSHEKTLEASPSSLVHIFD